MAQTKRVKKFLRHFESRGGWNHERLRDFQIEESTYRHHGTSGVRPVASGADGAKPVIGKAQSNRDAFSKMALKESIEK